MGNFLVICHKVGSIAENTKLVTFAEATEIEIRFCVCLKPAGDAEFWQPFRGERVASGDELVDHAMKGDLFIGPVLFIYIGIVKQYIESQHEHHKTTTFQDEYRRILCEHNVAFDERYVWD